MKSIKIEPASINYFYLLIETVEGSPNKMWLYQKTKKGLKAAITMFDCLLVQNGHTNEDVFIPDGCVQMYEEPDYSIALYIIKKSEIK